MLYWILFPPRKKIWLHSPIWVHRHCYVSFGRGPGESCCICYQRKCGASKSFSHHPDKKHLCLYNLHVGFQYILNDICFSGRTIHVFPKKKKKRKTSNLNHFLIHALHDDTKGCSTKNTKFQVLTFDNLDTFPNFENLDNFDLNLNKSWIYMEIF